ncbi:hypothetical protein [Salmon gill poxvirus]
MTDQTELFIDLLYTLMKNTNDLRASDNDSLSVSSVSSLVDSECDEQSDDGTYDFVNDNIHDPSDSWPPSSSDSLVKYDCFVLPDLETGIINTHDHTTRDHTIIDIDMDDI